MVASILRLRLAGLANALRRPRPGVGRASLAVVVVLVVVALVAIGSLVVVGHGMSSELRRVLLVTVGAVLVLGFWLLPLAFAADDGMTPRAFAPFGIAPRRLALALAVSGVATVPAALLALLVLAQTVVWADRGIGVAVVALVGGGLGLASAVLGARIASSVAAEAVDGPSARGLAGLLVLAAVAVVGPALVLLATVDWPAVGATELRRWAAVLAWTPIGAPWSVAGDVAAGDGAAAVGRLAVAVATAAVLWLLWERLVVRAVTGPEAVDTVRRAAGVGVFAAFPATPGGAIAARSLVYWVRDPRYSVPPLILPVVPIVLVAAFAVAGVPPMVTVWLPVPIVCLLIGWLVHNDVSMDGTAFWLHVVAGVDGRADRWGRLVVPASLGVVVAVAGSVLSALVIDEASIILPLTALSLAALGSALGVSSAVSARWPYPSVAPGDGPFAQPQESGDGGGASEGWSLLLAALLCLPTAGLIALGQLVDPVWSIWAVVVGAATALGALVVGVESGARVVTEAAPELLAFARRN